MAKEIKKAPLKKAVAKKIPAEKTPAKRVSSVKGAAPSGVEEKAAEEKRRELAELAVDMVLEDLSFMVAQAKILVHNRRTEELQDELAAEFERPGALSRAQRRERPVALSKTPSGNFNLDLGGDFILLTPEEAAPLARIALDEADEAERAARMLRWLDRERRDILNDAGISGPRSPALLAILRCFASTFRKKKG